MINGKDKSESNLTPKFLKTRCKKKLSTNKVQNVMMFSFYSTIKLGSMMTRALNINSTLFFKKFKENKVMIFHDIIHAKNFNSRGALSMNHDSKSLRNFISMLEKIYSSESEIAINK